MNTRIVKNFFEKTFVLTMIIIIWQIIATMSCDTIIPSPLEVVAAAVSMIANGSIFMDIMASLKRVIVGFSAAALFGISFAIIAGYYREAGSYFRPLIEIIRPIPPIAWIPIAILLFGLGDCSAYFIVFMGSMPPIFTSTFFGATSLPDVYRNTAKSFDIDGFRYVKNILFGFSLPYIFTGMKIGIGMAWMTVIAAELMGAQSGLGYLIQINRLMLRTDNVIAVMLFIGLVGYSLNVLISAIEKNILVWQNLNRNID